MDTYVCSNSHFAQEICYYPNRVTAVVRKSDRKKKAYIHKIKIADSWTAN